jgi:hypothetical protein
VTDSLLTSVAFIAAGSLIYLSAGSVARFFSDWADRSERDGVIRYGGGLPGNKVWKENSPEKFESRIQGLRFSAAFARWGFKVFGLLFAIAGIAGIVGSLLR